MSLPFDIWNQIFQKSPTVEKYENIRSLTKSNYKSFKSYPKQNDKLIAQKLVQDLINVKIPKEFMPKIVEIARDIKHDKDKLYRIPNKITREHISKYERPNFIMPEIFYNADLDNVNIPYTKANELFTKLWVDDYMSILNNLIINPKFVTDKYTSIAFELLLPVIYVTGTYYTDSFEITWAGGTDLTQGEIGVLKQYIKSNIPNRIIHSTKDKYKPIHGLDTMMYVYTFYVEPSYIKKK